MIDKVICDNCSEEFTIRLKIKKLDGDIEQTLFSCPRCRTEYPVAKSSAKTRELKQVIGKMQQLHDAEPNDELYKEIVDAREEHKIEAMQLEGVLSARDYR